MFCSNIRRGVILKNLIRQDVPINLNITKEAVVKQVYQSQKAVFICANGAVKQSVSYRSAIIFFSALFLIIQGWQITLYGQQNNSETTGVDSTLSIALQNMLDEGVSALGLMGVSAAVIVPGQGEWVGASGMSDPVAGDSIRPEMIFSAGSITKNIVAVLMLKLAEEGLLTLEDSLGQWLSSYPNIDGGITIRQLLNHSSGLYNFTEHPAYEATLFADLTREWAPEEIITTFVDAPYFPPGAGQEYSNTNYVLAGMIIELATGAEVSSVLRDRFWTPLNLNSTFFAVEEQIVGEVAHGWIDLDGDGVLEDISPFPITAFLSAIWTSGAIFSTAEDIAHWGQALFGGQVITQASIDELVDFIPGVGYGLGTFNVELQGRELWGHDGGGVGYNSLLLYDPQDGICISVMLNIDESSLPVPGSNVIILNALLGVVLEYIVTGIDSPVSEVPLAFELHQNYPNPFNPVTNIGFRISESGFVRLAIYDVAGRLVKMLVNETREAGIYTAQWDATNDTGVKVGSGMYFYKLQANGFKQVKRMILLK